MNLRLTALHAATTKAAADLLPGLPPPPPAPPNPFRAGGRPDTQFQADTAPKAWAPSAAAVGPGASLLHQPTAPPPAPGPIPGITLPTLPAAPSPVGVGMQTAGNVARDPAGYFGRVASQALPALAAPLGDTLAKATESKPPATVLGWTEKLGPLQGPADAVLGGAQQLFKDNPAAFAGIVGGLGKPLVEPLLSTPFGLPAMAGLYGLTTGGPSFGAAHTFFRPLTDKLGL